MNRLFAQAKLTWSLEVLGVRDDGLHELRAEMLSLDLADVIEIEAATTTSIEWVDAPELAPATADDLIARSLAAVGASARVRVHKRVPIGGGLGGGSSDAATILYWCGVEDQQLAGTIGSDVPFCIRGGRATVTGVGDVVEPLEFEERLVTLFVPTFSVNTAACYRAYDELVSAGQTPGGRNHLAQAAAVVEPRLEVLSKWVTSETGVEAVLCGSGSTVFVEGWAGRGALSSEVPALGGTWPGGSRVETPVGVVGVVHAKATRPR